MAGKLYCIMGAFIHPHKDCSGEFIDGLTFDEANAIRALWVKDKVHKNVHIVGSEKTERLSVIKGQDNDAG